MIFRQMRDWRSVESIVIIATDLRKLGNRIAIEKIVEVN